MSTYCSYSIQTAGYHIWNSQTDEFMIKLNGLKLGSKQSLLRITASIFDHLSFYYQIQDIVLCTHKIDWDEPLTEDDLASWAPIMAELQLLSNCSVKWCYYDIGSEMNEVELHGFCDTYEHVYAACGRSTLMAMQVSV